MIIDTLFNHQLWQNCQQKQMYLSNVGTNTHTKSFIQMCLFQIEDLKMYLILFW